MTRVSARSRTVNSSWSIALVSTVASAMALTALLGTPAVAPAPALAAHTYDNPLPMTGVPGGNAESCADPSVIKGQQPGDAYWYMYCTTDPLSSEDVNASGDLIFHLIPQFRSLDLVTWEYRGDAFAALPPTAAPGAGLWAPEIDYDATTNTYFLFYGVTNVADAFSPQSTPGCRDDNGIAYATSSSPTGPWAEQGIIVPPRPNAPTPTCNFFWTYDPEVILGPAGAGFIYYGSYYGGIEVRPLAVVAPTEPGLSPSVGLTGTPTKVAIANRYEGAEVVTRTVNGTLYYYLFVSATDCCRGPLTGYSVFVGRSTSATGPFVDHLGRPLNPEPADGQVGGTPVLSMNGNGWVGPGHNTVFDDFAGRTWTIYHAIDSADPYFAGEFGFDKRPAMLDPIDWSADGWPNVRNGNWISDGAMPAPAAQPGHGPSAYAPTAPPADEPGALLAAYSDEFTGTLGSQWSWVREPAATEYGIEGGLLRFNVQKADLFEDSNTAPVLLEPAPPTGDYIVEVRVRLNLPEGGCCHNFTQAGLVIYGGNTGTAGDDSFVKLVHFSLWETRQTEFAKEVPPPGPHPGGGAAGTPGASTAEYGNTVVGPPDEWTFLRIVKRTIGGVEHYRAYTSRDADANGAPDGWYRGGVWTHSLGSRIGLVSMAEPGDQEWVAYFDYVRVYTIAAPAAPPTQPPTAAPTAAPTAPPRPPARALPNTSTGELATTLPLALWTAVAFVSAWTYVAARRRVRR